MTDIKKLQSAYLRAVTERDNAMFQLTRLKAERDKAVEDLHGYCKACKHLKTGLLEEPCRNCNKIVKQNFVWRGLEVLECEK